MTVCVQYMLYILTWNILIRDDVIILPAGDPVVSSAYKLALFVKTISDLCFYRPKECVRLDGETI